MADVTEFAQLLHGVENVVRTDAGYTGVEQDNSMASELQIVARRSTSKYLSKRSAF